MGIRINLSQPAEEPKKSEEEKKHQQAIDFTQKMIEDILSSNDKSNKSGRGV